MRTTRLVALALSFVALPLLASQGCSAASNTGEEGTSAGTGVGGSGGGAGECGTCFVLEYTPCNPDGTPGDPIVCDEACLNGVGCVECLPGSTICIGNEVWACDPDGMGHGQYVETCDTSLSLVCHDGECSDACEVADDQASNVGCEFWAVDLDQVDLYNDPASAPFGVAMANAGQTVANVTVEYNVAPQGAPLDLVTHDSVSVAPGALVPMILPVREVDCGVVPNDYTAPGTCLSSQAYRITSSAPIVVYQFNVFTNAYSNDASLLLPTNALGQIHRILGWPAGHPIYIAAFGVIDRSYVTIVGTQPQTEVTVTPSWRIRGNPPIPPTPAGGEIKITIGMFDVLNLETDDGTMQDDPKTITDLTSTIVTADKPIAVFSGVESTQAPLGVVDIPTYPGWTEGDSCCLDHLEEQMFPVEAVGTKYVVTRSPIRSTGSYHEPDVIRFLGVAEVANVTTSLPAPFDSFTLQPGEVRTTYAQADFVVESDKPVMVAQLLISQQYVDGPYTGDPSLTVFPPVEQYRTEYVILTPPSWSSNYVVISAEVNSTVSINGVEPTNCVVTTAGTADGLIYESRRCPLEEGVHQLTGNLPFGIVAYGYGSAGSYAFAGGADVKHIYDPPPLK